MFAKAFLILTLLVSLLFVTQVQPLASPTEMKPGGVCVQMQCAPGCCANMICCKVTEQQKAPQTPAPASQYTHVQLAALGLYVQTPFFLPPARERPLVILDDVSRAHTLPPLAVSCIQLI